jgi:hypothetical protein
MTVSFGGDDRGPEEAQVKQDQAGVSMQVEAPALLSSEAVRLCVSCCFGYR